MNFDLEALDRFDPDKDSSQAKSSRFNPRTQPRPRPKPQQRPNKAASQGREASQAAAPSATQEDGDAATAVDAALESRLDAGVAAPTGEPSSARRPVANQTTRHSNAAVQVARPPQPQAPTVAPVASAAGVSTKNAAQPAAASDRAQTDAQPASRGAQRQARQPASRPRTTVRPTATEAATQLASDWPEPAPAVASPQAQAAAAPRQSRRPPAARAAVRRNGQAASPEAAKRVASEDPSPLPLAKRPAGTMVRGRPRNALPEQLDVETMSLKEVIRWSNGKEREALNAEKRRKEVAALAAAQAASDVDGRAAAASPPPQSQLPARSEAPMNGAAIAPQVHIVNGQIVVNQTTLTVQAQPEDTQRAIVVDDQRLNSHSYAVNRLPSTRWTEEETENFYAALATFGSDFTLIANVFPNKNRRQVKNKFTKESKVNPMRIDDALKGRGCNSIAYEDVLGRIQYDPDATDMLQIEAPQPAD